MNNLPSQSQALVGRLTALHEEQKALIAELGRSRDLGAAYRSQLGDITKSYEQEMVLSAENTTDPKTTMAWAELVRRRSEYEGELQSLVSQYKEKHPDVLQAETDRRHQGSAGPDDWRVEDADRRTPAEAHKAERSAHPDAQDPTSLWSTATSTGSKKLLSETNKQIAELDGRINAIPNAEVGLEAIDRDYQTKKLNYDNLLAQQQKIVVGADAAKEQQGGGIQVVDPANLPERPVAPKRFCFDCRRIRRRRCAGFTARHCG